MRFLLGVSLQVLLAGINKYTMWLSYYAAWDASVEEKRVYALAKWMSSQVWVDFVIDATTLLMFGSATYRILLDVAAGP